MAREAIGKKLRFEVFKRDSFTCQYCGQKAPEVVLHCDHINPVAEGGKAELLNLVTACEGCNLGKGARLLDDRSAIQRQRTQLEQTQARREQLEMLLDWRDSMEREAIDVVEEVCRRIATKTYYEPSAAGRDSVRKWIKKFGVKHVLAAADFCFDKYLVWRKIRPSTASWELAFSKIPGMANLYCQSDEKPYIAKLAYINGIMRNRFGDRNESFMGDLEHVVTRYAVPLDILESCAKVTDNWSDFIHATFTCFKARVDQMPAEEAARIMRILEGEE